MLTTSQDSTQPVHREHRVQRYLPREVALTKLISTIGESIEFHGDFIANKLYRTKKDKRGRMSEEEIVIKHRDKDESVSPTSGPSLDFSDPWKPVQPSRRNRKPRSLEDEDTDSSIAGSSSHATSRRDIPRDLELEVEAEIEEEIKIHKKKMKHRSPIEKITKENVDEWSVVHTPAKEDVVEMTGALEVVEVAPKGSLEEDLDIRGRVEQQVVKERRDERWTEITKDLVVRDAIERLGYEFEETRTFYYIFSFLEPVSLLLCPVLFS